MTQPEERDDTAKVVEPSATGRRPADTFAVRLILVRHLNGLTIGEAARVSGLNDATWSTWEAGRRPRDILDVCHRIATALDIDEHWLIFGGPLAGPRGMPTERRKPLPRGYQQVARRPKSDRPKTRPDTDRRPTQPPRPEQRRPVRISRPAAA